MRLARHVIAAMFALVTGAAVGLGGVAVYAWWWGLFLVVAGTLAAELGCRPGLQRVAFAVGWLVPVCIAMVPRSEGDFAIERGVAGYVLVGLGAAAVVLASATLPRRSGNLEDATRV